MNPDGSWGQRVRSADPCTTVVLYERLRSNYGIVGDAVNTTQRIEQLAKEVCHDRPTVAILVSATTRLQAGDRFRFTDAGAHAVRGRQELVRIFRFDAPLAEAAQAAGGRPRLRLATGHG